MSITRVPIRTAEDRYPKHPVGGSQGYVDEWWVRYQGNTAVPEGIALGESVVPIVNHGRWVIVCPNPMCHSVQWASKKHPQFLCVECGNYRVDAWIKVEWPAETAQIEQILGARPDRHTRHSHETGSFVNQPAADLQAENDMNGVR